MLFIIKFFRCPNLINILQIAVAFCLILKSATIWNHAVEATMSYSILKRAQVSYLFSFNCVDILDEVTWEIVAVYFAFYFLLYKTRVVNMNLRASVIFSACMCY